MTISKRTLLQWRKEALKERCTPLSGNYISVHKKHTERLLILTQQLIDEELKKEK